MPSSADAARSYAADSSSTPSSSSRTSTARRASSDISAALKIEQGKPSSRLASSFNKLLASFETTPHSDWATQSSLLTQLLRCLESHKEVVGVVRLPDPLLFCRALWRALDPQNVLGVHRKALEVLVFYAECMHASPWEKEMQQQVRQGGSRIVGGGDRLSHTSAMQHDFPFLLLGVLKLIPQSSVQLKGDLLSFVERFIVRALPPRLLRVCLRALFTALLPSLEESEGNPMYRRAMELMLLARHRVSDAVSADPLLSRGASDEEQRAEGSACVFAVLWDLLGHAPGVRAPAATLLRLLLADEEKREARRLAAEGGDVETAPIASSPASLPIGEEETSEPSSVPRHERLRYVCWGGTDHTRVHAALFCALQSHDSEKTSRAVLDIIIAYFPLHCGGESGSSDVGGGHGSTKIALSSSFSPQEMALLVAAAMHLIGTPGATSSLVRRVATWLYPPNYPAGGSGSYLELISGHILCCAFRMTLQGWGARYSVSTNGADLPADKADASRPLAPREETAIRALCAATEGRMAQATEAARLRGGSNLPLIADGLLDVECVPVVWLRALLSLFRFTVETVANAATSASPVPDEELGEDDNDDEETDAGGVASSPVAASSEGAVTPFSSLSGGARTPFVAIAAPMLLPHLCDLLTSLESYKAAHQRLDGKGFSRLMAATLGKLFEVLPWNHFILYVSGLVALVAAEADRLFKKSNIKDGDSDRESHSDDDTEEGGDDEKKQNWLSVRLRLEERFCRVYGTLEILEEYVMSHVKDREQQAEQLASVILVTSLTLTRVVTTACGVLRDARGGCEEESQSSDVLERHYVAMQLVDGSVQVLRLLTLGLLAGLQDRIWPRRLGPACLFGLEGELLPRLLHVCGSMASTVCIGGNSGSMSSMSAGSCVAGDATEDLFNRMCGMCKDMAILLTLWRAKADAVWGLSPPSIPFEGHGDEEGDQVHTEMGDNSTVEATAPVYNTAFMRWLTQLAVTIAAAPRTIALEIASIIASTAVDTAVLLPDCVRYHARQESVSVPVVSRLWLLLAVHDSETDSRATALLMRLVRLPACKRTLDALMLGAATDPINATKVVALLRHAVLMCMTWRQQQHHHSQSATPPQEQMGRVMALLFTGYHTLLSSLLPQPIWEEGGGATVNTTRCSEVAMPFFHEMSAFPLSLALPLLFATFAPLSAMPVERGPESLKPEMLSDAEEEVSVSRYWRLRQCVSFTGATVPPQRGEADGAEAENSVPAVCQERYEYVPLTESELVQLLHALMLLPNAQAGYIACMHSCTPSSVTSLLQMLESDLGPHYGLPASGSSFAGASKPNAFTNGSDIGNNNNNNTGDHTQPPLFASIISLLITLARRVLLPPVIRDGTVLSPSPPSSTSIAVSESMLGGGRSSRVRELVTLLSCLDRLLEMSSSATITEATAISLVRHTWARASGQLIVLLHAAVVQDVDPAQSPLLQLLLHVVRLLDRCDRHGPESAYDVLARSISQWTSAPFAAPKQTTTNTGPREDTSVAAELKRQAARIFSLPQLYVVIEEGVGRAAFHHGHANGAMLHVWSQFMIDALPHLHRELAVASNHLLDILLSVLEQSVNISAAASYDPAALQTQLVCYNTAARIIAFTCEAARLACGEKRGSAKERETNNGGWFSSGPANSGGADAEEASLWALSPLLEPARHALPRLLKCCCRTLSSDEYEPASHGEGVSSVNAGGRGALIASARATLTLLLKEARLDFLRAFVLYWGSRFAPDLWSLLAVPALESSVGQAGAASAAEAQSKEAPSAPIPYFPHSYRIGGGGGGGQQRQNQFNRMSDQRSISAVTRSSSSSEAECVALMVLDDTGATAAQLIEAVGTMSTALMSSRVAKWSKGKSVDGATEETVPGELLYFFFLDVTLKAHAARFKEWRPSSEEVNALLAVLTQRLNSSNGGSWQAPEPVCVALLLSVLNRVVSRVSNIARIGAAVRADLYKDLRFSTVVQRALECISASYTTETCVPAASLLTTTHNNTGTSAEQSGTAAQAVSCPKAWRFTLHATAALLPDIFPLSDVMQVDGHAQVVQAACTLCTHALIPAIQAGITLTSQQHRPSEADLTARAPGAIASLRLLRVLLTISEVSQQQQQQQQPHAASAATSSVMPVARRVRVELFNTLFMEHFFWLPRTVLREWLLAWRQLCVDRSFKAIAFDRFSPDTSASRIFTALLTSFETEAANRAQQLRCLAAHILALPSTGVSDRELLNFVKERIEETLRTFSPASTGAGPIPTVKEVNDGTVVFKPVKAVLFLFRVLLVRAREAQLAPLWPLVLPEVLRALSLYVLEQPNGRTGSSTAPGAKASKAERRAAAATVLTEAKTQDIQALQIEALKVVDMGQLVCPERFSAFRWFFSDDCDTLPVPLITSAPVRPATSTEAREEARGLATPWFTFFVPLLKERAAWYTRCGWGDPSILLSELDHACHDDGPLAASPAWAHITAGDAESSVSLSAAAAGTRPPASASAFALLGQPAASGPSNRYCEGLPRPLLTVPETHYKRFSGVRVCAGALAALTSLAPGRLPLATGNERRNEDCKAAVAMAPTRVQYADGWDSEFLREMLVADLSKTDPDTHV